MGRSRRSGPEDQRSRGQSLVELALILPVVLLLTLIAIDFGRVYLGWVNLQNMARVAANYASNNPTAWATNDTTAKATYQNQIRADAKQNNCALPLVSGVQTAPDPTFTPSTDLGGNAQVQLSCTFRILTPIISNIIGTGGNLTVSASSTFPIKSGLFATGGSTAVAPIASFTGSPTSIVEGASVQFTDTSTGAPTVWTWDFGDGSVGSSAKNPVHPYAAAGLYTVILTVTNSIGSDSKTRNSYITVTVGPPTVNFTGTPVSGNKPLSVDFVGTSTGTPTSVLWTFGDGATSGAGLAVTHVYANAGTYTVRLDVTTASGTGFVVKANYITVAFGNCTVPDFIGTSSSNAQATWASKGFTTTVQFQQGGTPWTISSQTLVGLSTVPCNSPITVSKN